MRIRLAVLLALCWLCCSARANTVVLHSSADLPAALRAHGLARVWGPAFIARDLPPGVAWRESIAALICGADRVLVVWSAKAAASAEVAAELATALTCRTPMVPLLLDSTPLPPGLAWVHAVDWR